MLTTPSGVIALSQLRQELQEDAGDKFPQDVMRELLLLYDVCQNLDLNIFQCQEVLGKPGWRSVIDFIKQPL